MSFSHNNTATFRVPWHALPLFIPNIKSNAFRSKQTLHYFSNLFHTKQADLIFLFLAQSKLALSSSLLIYRHTPPPHTPLFYTLIHPRRDTWCLKKEKKVSEGNFSDQRFLFLLRRLLRHVQEDCTTCRYPYASRTRWMREIRKIFNKFCYLPRLVLF